jgi:hypothetical protein
MYINWNYQTLKAIHICNSLQPPQKSKIAKEYVFANASKFAEKKYENTTMYKNNSGFCDKFKGSIFVQSLVLNLKISTLKSATILIQTVVAN